VGKEHNLKSLNELESQITKRLEEFQEKRKKNQKKNQIYSLGQIGLTALTTLLIAINVKLSLFEITLATLVTSTLASVAGQLLNKYMYQERMAMNISTICALYELNHTIIMDKKKEEDDGEAYQITIQKVESYQNQYQQILNTANGQWKKYLEKTQGSKK
jgi:hypothetical protein